MNINQFVDTNILIYAHDQDAGDKRARAAAVLRELWETHTGILSIQVLQELFVNVTRKIAQPLSLATARGLIAAYRVWQIEVPTVDTVLHAAEIQDRYRLSFWDAMIVATAVSGRAEVLLSEDLSHGQIIEGVRVQNPFLH